ncbi:MCF2L2 [Bugula neritina]|uniref:MCF2L2 n=1 Tax=Bugula neritina TaxID=10212 RepID=A0A7J7J371_BUGNE|nr:MCF2L2 [Bugula neritina]
MCPIATGHQNNRVRDKKNSSKRGESLGSVTSDTSSMMSSYTIEEKYHKSETDHHSESSELLSESSDQFTALAKEVSELTTETSQTPDSAVAKWRRGSIKALKARFSKKKTRQDMLDDRSDQSLNVNTGIFEKSLTMEEEKSLAKTRSKLIEDLVESERKYADELKVLYMRPIAEAGDSVSTELYANQTLLFANLEELYEFSSKTFLPELIDSAGSPSLIASAFKNRVKDLSKFKEYCTSRSRAEVLLRQLANDTFLIECAQKTSSTLHSQLLLPARHMSSYNTFLQSMYSNLKDDLEAQRDTQLVLSLLSDTMQTATNLLHQVTIDGYHLSDSSLQKTSETSAKFVFRCNNESYLIQCEVTEQPFWYENIMFAVNNCENKSQEYSSNRGHKSSMAPLPLNSFNHTPAPKLQSPLQDDVVLAADPDVDMFDLDNDTDAFDEMTRSHNSNSFNEVKNGI